ncbi:PH domain-containing protein [Neolewinella litorea]|uniref:PH domain-containing protein n=1 Tax=Neolewinella litorea TaxID=2562452 RepID=A0A4S4NI61_9BACT|nr:PH domain-containing protein [Neolewinella litorea]THH39424.1 PH domain-containing protein [Neolewinella litorea]
MDLLTSFSVTSQTTPDDGHDLIHPLLAEGETIELAYKHVRDRVWFTDRRILTLDVQGLTGSKKNFRSFPYGKIGSYAVETAGLMDTDADFKIWVSGVGLFEINFSRTIDVTPVNRLLASRVV